MCRIIPRNCTASTGKSRLSNVCGPDINAEFEVYFVYSEKTHSPGIIPASLIKSKAIPGTGRGGPEVFPVRYEDYLHIKK
jgi:hypothetical protein